MQEKVCNEDKGIGVKNKQKNKQTKKQRKQSKAVSYSIKGTGRDFSCQKHPLENKCKSKEIAKCTKNS